MANISCSSQYVAITSGSKVKVITYSDPSQVKVFDLKMKPKDSDGNKQEEQKGKKNNEEEAASGIDPHLPTGRVLAAAFSNSGAYYAACTDEKELTLWNTREEWPKLWTRTVVKRCMAVTFDVSETALYVADKAGDVYRFEINDDRNEPTLILGHVSMLLDVVVSPNSEFIMTAERDEKIRVSHLPNAYNIHTFCLGHTEFVSRLAMLSSNHLLSCAGDSTMRLWDYREGTELCQTSYDWAKPKSSEPGPKNEATVTCIACCKERSLVAMAILDHYAVPIYHITTDEDGNRRFHEVTRINCKHPPWSLTFDPNGKLLVLVPDPEAPLLVMTVETKNDGSWQVSEDLSTESTTAALVKRVQSDWEFLQCSCNVQSALKGLHKVPFDNMQDYLQRKQQRIENNHAKKGRRRQARKRNKAKKRAIEDAAGNGEDCKRTMLEHDDDEVDEDEEEVDQEEMDSVEVNS